MSVSLPATPLDRDPTSSIPSVMNRCCPVGSPSASGESPMARTPGWTRTATPSGCRLPRSYGRRHPRQEAAQQPTPSRTVASASSILSLRIDVGSGSVDRFDGFPRSRSQAADLAALTGRIDPHGSPRHRGHGDAGVGPVQLQPPMGWTSDHRPARLALQPLTHAVESTSNRPVPVGWIVPWGVERVVGSPR